MYPHVRESQFEICGDCKCITYSARFTDGVFGSFPKALAMEISEELMPYYLLAVWFGMGLSTGSAKWLVSP